MVNALMSSRTSSSNCRYQRPSNSHTPPSYTPYCYTTSILSNSATTSQTSQNSGTSTTSRFLDDDCCCVSSSTSNYTSQQIGPLPQESSLRNDIPTALSTATSNSSATLLSLSVSTCNNVSASTTSAFKNRTETVPSSSCNSSDSNNNNNGEQVIKNSSNCNTLPVSEKPKRPTSLALNSDGNSTPSPTGN